MCAARRWPGNPDRTRAVPAALVLSADWGQVGWQPGFNIQVQVMIGVC
jgi:hypothetical protein